MTKQKKTKTKNPTQTTKKFYTYVFVFLEIFAKGIKDIFHYHASIYRNVDTLWLSFMKGCTVQVCSYIHNLLESQKPVSLTVSQCMFR